MLEELTKDFIDWISILPPLGIYGVFFLVAYIENIIPPIPGDILVVFSGYLAAEQIVNGVYVLLLTTVASVMGFMTVYWLGSHWGTRIKKEKERFWMMRFIKLKYMEKARGWMQEYGQGVILANRFLAGTRSVISLTAGISHTDVTKTVISSTISSILWNSILIGFGWLLYENWHVIGEYLSVYSRIILAAILFFVLIRVAIYYYRKRRNPRSENKKTDEFL